MSTKYNVSEGRSVRRTQSRGSRLTAELEAVAAQSSVDVAADHQGNTPPGRNAKRPKLTLTALIALVTSITIVVSSGASLGVMSAVTQAIMNGISEEVAVVSAIGGANGLLNVLNSVSDFARAVGDVHQDPSSSVPVPTDDTSGETWRVTEIAARACILGHQQLLTTLNLAGVIYADSSIVLLTKVYDGTGVTVTEVSFAGVPTDSSCCAQRRSHTFRTADMAPLTWVPDPLSSPLYLNRTLMSSIGQQGAFFGGSRDPLWAGIDILTVGTTQSFQVNAVAPAYNSSGAFLGLTLAYASLTTVDAFLRTIRPTTNAELFVIDSAASVLATSADVQYVTRLFTDAGERATEDGPNCARAASFSSDSSAAFIVLCRTLAVDLAAAPALQKMARQGLATPRNGDRNVEQVTADGNTYFVAAVGANPRARGLSLSFVAVVPFNDLAGSLGTIRIVTITTLVVFTVIIAALAAFLVSNLLAPLETIATRMRHTAQLRGTPADAASHNSGDDASAVREIYDLQDAYRGMSVAINNFTRYVPKDVVKDLMASGELCSIRMRPAQCVTQFVDIAGFTSMCERVPVGELSDLVHDYFDTMSRVVMGHDGNIDKFIGDAIMAVWGVPFAVPNAELRAVLCGLSIVRETRAAELARSFDEAGEQLRVRVGIAAGEVLAGNMGSAERMNYTVIGDSVNLAARLEGLNKQLGTDVMISGAVAAELRGAVACRLLCTVRVVGKDEAVSVYEPVGVAAAGDDSSASCVLPASVAAEIEAFEDTQSKPPGTTTERQSSTGRTMSMRGSASRDERMSMRSDNSRRPRDANDGPASAGDLVERAAAPRPYRIVADARDRESLALFSNAVSCFQHADFAGCIALLDRLEVIVSSAAATAPTMMPRSFLSQSGAESNDRGGTDPTDGSATSAGVLLTDGGTSAEAPAMRDWRSNMVPLMRLRELCDQYLQQPDPNFDPAWRVGQK